MFVCLPEFSFYRLYICHCCSFVRSDKLNLLMTFNWIIWPVTIIFIIIIIVWKPNKRNQKEKNCCYLSAVQKTWFTKKIEHNNNEGSEIGKKKILIHSGTTTKTVTITPNIEQWTPNIKYTKLDHLFGVV